MAQERDGAAKVIAQEGERVQVEHKTERLTVPMRGFPPGFKLRPGGRVILVDESSGPVARPLVRALRARVARETVQQRGTLEVEGRRLEMQPGTIIDEPKSDAEARALEDYELWVVERTGTDQDQVVAARRLRNE
ncbi:MAG: hypothetical protein ACRERX_14445 [Pseudomonas sp.]